MENINDTTNPNSEENNNNENQRNDSATVSDDTIGENTELTPLAKEILKEEDKKVAASDNQQNKDFSGEDG